MRPGNGLISTARSAELRPPYVRIAGEVRRRIVAGELQVGDRLPSTRAVTREFGVTLATAAKALDVLSDDGLVRAVPRVGRIVT
ncbi:GntR family transcriptional regulator [Pseudonocardia sp. TRM90224]|uniref:GntR family transcriptional regulator n=1 Tax=Pseudonocardia sp. TRM90224 TaxID=2812678 RepID=UPI0035A925A2